MNNIEDSIIKKMSASKTPTNADIEAWGKIAEEVIIEFLHIISGMRVRHATPEEDSGKHMIIKDAAIDAVGYLDEIPAIGFQITTAISKGAREEKTRDLMARPFIRLPEMTPKDTAIPRVIVFVDREEIIGYISDHDLKKHPRIIDQVVESNINSLKLDLMKTKNPREQELIEKLMLVFTRGKTQIQL